MSSQRVRTMNRLFVVTLLGLGIAATAAPEARADVSTAARAFSDGQAAQLEGNYDRAAQSFELAYTIAPSKEALRSAVRARQLSNQLPRAATLAQVLLSQYGDDPASAKLASDVIADARQKLARLTVTCPSRCTLAIGGRAISINASTSHVVFATAGRQSLEISFDDDESVTRELTLKAGDDLSLPIEQPPVKHVFKSKKPTDAEAAAAPAPEPEPPHERRRLPPVFALAGTVATLAVGSVAVWSALDTKNAHDAYVAMPTPAGWKSGQSKQNRTNYLLGTTAGVGVITAVVALFFTRWHDESLPVNEVAVAPSAGGWTFALGSSF